MRYHLNFRCVRDVRCSSSHDCGSDQHRENVSHEIKAAHIQTHGRCRAQIYKSCHQNVSHFVFQLVPNSKKLRSQNKVRNCIQGRKRCRETWREREMEMPISFIKMSYLISCKFHTAFESLDFFHCKRKNSEKYRQIEYILEATATYKCLNGFMYESKSQHVLTCAIANMLKRG